MKMQFENIHVCTRVHYATAAPQQKHSTYTNPTPQKGRPSILKNKIKKDSLVILHIRTLVSHEVCERRLRRLEHNQVEHPPRYLFPAKKKKQRTFRRLEHNQVQHPKKKTSASFQVHYLKQYQVQLQSFKVHQLKLYSLAKPPLGTVAKLDHLWHSSLSHQQLTASYTSSLRSHTLVALRSHTGCPQCSLCKALPVYEALRYQCTRPEATSV